MELPPSRITENQPPNKKPAEKLNMEILTMTNYSSIMPEPQNAMQQGNYNQISSIPLRQRSSRERVALPSIRQAVPEIGFGSIRPESSGYPSDRTSYSPVGNRSIGNPLENNSLDPCNKRRRVSAQESGASELGEYALPNIHTNSQQAQARSTTTSPTEIRQSGYFAEEKWQSSNSRMSNQASTLPALRSPSEYESPMNDFRPTLPSLTSLTLEPGASILHGQFAWSGRSLNGSWPTGQSALYHPRSSFSAPLPVSSSIQQSEYFSCEQPMEKLFSTSSGRGQQQISNESMLPPQIYYSERPGVSGISGIDGAKHRKRRGNLPKETTDKLRAWFVAHLHHPYPTEDEKLELMKQTRLQMNQISNWFINARRRQLPALINDARVECDTPSVNASEPTPKPDEFGEQGNQSVGLCSSVESDSNGEYEDDADVPERVKSSNSSTAPDMALKGASSPSLGS